jgi:DNA-binding HxlR family transcriptional regulator
VRLTVRQALHAGREAEAVAWLARLGVATRDQLVALAWPDLHPEAAKARLRRLCERGLVEAVRLAEGGGRSVYRLTGAGAQAAAALAKDARLAAHLGRSQLDTIHLSHRLAVNGAVVELVRRLGNRLEVLYPHERRLRWQVSGGLWREVTPDAVLVAGDTAVALEFDRGTRSMPALAAQVRRYAEAAQVPDLPPWAKACSVVYVLQAVSARRAEAVLQAAESAGIAGRVAVTTVGGLGELARRLAERAGV